MSISKKFLKSKPVCKVTFKLKKDQVDGASTVHLVGDFNDWNKESHPMKGLKNGSFSAVLDLESGRDYQFRYLIDGDKWLNDEGADSYVASPYGDQNAVVSCQG